MKIKTIIQSILFFIIGTSSAFSADFEADGICYNITSTTDYTVEVNYNLNDAYSGDIVIPETVEYNNTTYTVTSIGDNAFNSNGFPVSLSVLPDNEVFTFTW